MVHRLCASISIDRQILGQIHIRPFENILKAMDDIGVVIRDGRSVYRYMALFEISVIGIGKCLNTRRRPCRLILQSS